MDALPATPAPVGSGRTLAPRVWLLEGEKHGDNAQLHAVASALGEAVATRRIVVHPRYRRAKPWVRPSLHHIDASASDRLEAPWPQLVLAAGRRMSMVALWIRRASGGHTRIALLGKPRRLLHHFDLAVVGAQHAVGDAPNVLRIALPLMRIDAAQIERERAAWRERLAGFARPLTAVLVGGPIRLGALGPATAARLSEGVRRLQERDGGSVVFVTSRRTPASVVSRLERDVPGGGRLFPFVADEADLNPYRALLGEADRFVVTADSLSMMVEVARLGRPLSVFPLDPTPWSRLGRFSGGRSLEALPRLLCERGLAVPFGEAFREPASEAPDELPRVVERVRALLPPA